MRDELNYPCPACGELYNYDLNDQICEKCEWWEQEALREQDRYERMMWEREQYERDLYRSERDD